MMNYDDTENVERNFKIFVRIHPLERSCKSCARIDAERKKIYVRYLQEMQPNRIAKSKDPSYWCFRTHGIFYETSQEEVYRVSAQDLVQKVLDGVSCVIIADGQAGSGKSFTIGGLRNHWEHRGLVARLLSDMFAEKANRRKFSEINYQLSFVELHGKCVKDLLVPEAENKIKINKINERDAFKDITVVSIKTEEEGLEKIFDGEAGRSIAKGSMYPASHTATSLITFHVSNISLITSWGVVTKAKMHILELAGAGTVGKSNSWKLASDVGKANLTRSQIHQYFSSLGNTGSSDGIIRSSNLLKILGNAFSVTSIIRFISHVLITKQDLASTISTLKFSSKIVRLKPVKTSRDINPELELTRRRLQDEVDSLRKELLLNDMFLRQEALSNISRTRAEQIQRNILNFLNGTISDFTLFSVSQAQVLLESLKDLYNKLSSRELEIEQLEEKPTNGAKKRPASGVSSKLSVISAESTSNNRKKAKNTARVPEEVESKLPEQVGSLDKTTTGVTLGPDESRNSDKPSQSLIAVKSKIKEVNVLKLFELFLNEDAVHTELKNDLDENERTLASFRQRYPSIFDEYSRVKKNLNNARDELKNHHEIRRFMEPEKENTVFSQLENSLARDISCSEKILLNLETKVTSLQEEIQKSIDLRVALRLKLEAAFQEYCERLNVSIKPGESLTKLLSNPRYETSFQNKIKRRFGRLRKMMIQEQRRMKIKEARLDQD